MKSKAKESTAAGDGLVESCQSAPCNMLASASKSLASLVPMNDTYNAVEELPSKYLTPPQLSAACWTSPSHESRHHHATAAMQGTAGVHKYKPHRLLKSTILHN